MSSFDRSEGVVFGNYSFGESNKVIKVFTRDKGLIKLVANGIRKTTSKYSGSMELMNIVSVLLRKSKSSDLYTIKEFELIKSYHCLREDYDTISTLYYVSEFLSKFFENEIPNAEIYEKLIMFLSLLESNRESLRELRWFLIINSLRVLGYVPNLDLCANCGRSLGDNIYVSGRDGWIFCSDCTEHKIDKKISVGAVNFIKTTLNVEFHNITRVKLSDKVKEDVEEFFRSIISSILGKELKSEKMLYSS